jgi:hypothetical protein
MCVLLVGWKKSIPTAEALFPFRLLISLSGKWRAYQPVLFMGIHECTLCPKDSRKVGYRNLLIPTRHLLYVAPELIIHYIEDHGYQPPKEFIGAVLKCPEQESADYMELLRPFEHYWSGT